MKTFIMPGGQRMEVATVADVERAYALSFAQYEGFVAKFPDPVLARFTLIIEDHAAKVGRDVLDPSAIAVLKRAPVMELQFGKIPDTAMPFEQLVGHVHAQYPGTQAQEVSAHESHVTREIALVDPQRGTPVCRIQHVPMGIPGSFVIVPPQL